MELSEKILENVEVFGFAGKLGSGKNYIAEKVFSKMLEPKLTVFLCFADQIKIDGIYKKGLDRNKCWIKKDEETRKTLQIVGTEEGRDVYGTNVWINNLKEWMIMHAYRGIKRIIISDVRFKNEFDFIKEIGGTTIKVLAPNRNKEALARESDGNKEIEQKIASHISETDLDKGRDFDYQISNDLGQEHEAIVQCRDIVREINNRNKEDIVIFCDLDNTICECNEFYTIQAEKVKKVIKENLKESIPDTVFNKMFNDFVNTHNGNHFLKFFHINSFSDGLSMVVKDFRPFLKEMSDDDFSNIINYIRQIGMDVFNFNYKEIPGRVEELKKLKEVGHVVIYTMGDRLEQSKKILSLGLSDFDFEIYDFKDETIYRNLKHRYPAKKYIMIGDSYSRDIKPASQVGMEAFQVVKDKDDYWKADTGEESFGFKIESLLEIYHALSDPKKGETNFAHQYLGIK